MKDATDRDEIRQVVRTFDDITEIRTERRERHIGMTLDSVKTTRQTRILTK